MDEFETNEKENIRMLIELVETPIDNGERGNPYLFRKLAAGGLMLVAKSSNCRSTVEKIAEVLSRQSFREEHAVVKAKLGTMPLQHDDRKSVRPLSRPPERASGAPARTSGAPQGMKR